MWEGAARKDKHLPVELPTVSGQIWITWSYTVIQSSFIFLVVHMCSTIQNLCIIVISTIRPAPSTPSGQTRSPSLQGQVLQRHTLMWLRQKYTLRGYGWIYLVNITLCSDISELAAQKDGWFLLYPRFIFTVDSDVFKVKWTIGG